MKRGQVCGLNSSFSFSQITESAYNGNLRVRKRARTRAFCARALFICKYEARHYTTILGPPSRSPSFVHKLSLLGGHSWEFSTLLFNQRVVIYIIIHKFTCNISIRCCWLELTEGAPDNSHQTDGG